MVGNQWDKIIDEVFTLGKEVMKQYGTYPYVDLVIKDGVIVSWGRNTERETRDVTNQSAVVAIRKAQEALDAGDLSGHALVGLFEPTMLGFDVALWSGIRSFVWCINSLSLPRHFNKMNYSPLIYAKNHPGKIEIVNGLREKEGLDLVKIAKEKKYYPDNLL